MYYLLVSLIFIFLSILFDNAIAQNAPRTNKPSSRQTSSGILDAAKRASALTPISASSIAAPAAEIVKDFDFGPVPAWVVQFSASTDRRPIFPSGQSKRYLLIDEQINATDKSQSVFFRTQVMASSQGTIKEASEPQLSFNPDFQRLTIHGVYVIRDGQRMNRTQEARMEVLRREQRLDQKIVDGFKTVLIIVPDVRVGDSVEVSSTVEGANPIFEKKLTGHLTLAADAWIDQLNLRIDLPVGRTLRFHKLNSVVEPESSIQNGRQVYSVQLNNIPALTPETLTPAWYKVFPSLQFTEYSDWKEVDAWAQKLFAPKPDDPTVAQIAQSIREKNLSPIDTVSAALRFVQDEIRYFSVSLGVNSHLPKEPAKTLRERLGDCKDKVLLFNALMKNLGFESQAVLVSFFRNKAVQSYLPSPTEFDHVIAKVRIGTQDYFVDPTLSQQGTNLLNQGYLSYGAGLLIGAQLPPQSIVPPSFAVNSIDFEQEWDLSDLQRSVWPVKLVMKAKGLPAEQWRNLDSQGVMQRWAQAVSGVYGRAYTGLRLVGEPQVQDDRIANTWQATLKFEYAGEPRYTRGAIEHEIIALELVDYLVSPPEGQRKMPYLLDMPNQLEHRITVKGMRPFTATLPPERQFGDKHFSGMTRAEAKGENITFITRLERRSDEVNAADMQSYRERIGEARRLIGSTVRLPLMDAQKLQPQFQEIDKRLAQWRRGGADQLLNILVNNEVETVFATESLKVVDTNSRLASKIITERGESSNLLNRFEDGLKDGEAALKAMPQSAQAHEVRGVSLMGLGRFSEATAAFDAANRTDSSPTPNSWLGIARYYAGDLLLAQQWLSEMARTSTGTEREFVHLWLYVVAEHRLVGSFKSLINQENMQPNDRIGFPRQLLRYMTDQIDQDTLIKNAKDAKAMERLNLAEAYFFIGQKLSAQGKREEAKTWFQKTIDIKALPYREHFLAVQEMRR